MAPPDAAYNNPMYGSQLTAGSGSVRGYFDAMLKAGATAREMLVAAGITGLPTAKIKVKSLLMGGGLGRKFEADYIAQAETGLDGSGKVTAATYRIVSPSILFQRGWIPEGVPDGQCTEGCTALANAYAKLTGERKRSLPLGISVATSGDD